MTIIGIVSDFRSGRFGVLQPDDTNALPQVFFLDVLRPMAGGELLVRTSGNPLSLVGPIRRIVEARPATRLLTPRTLDDQLSLAIAPRSFQTGLIVGFAGVALLIAIVGIYGVLSYSVSQRTHEIGVRMALGAQVRDVLELVLGRAAMLITLGIALGVVLSLGLTGLMTTLLYEVRPNDPWTFGVVALLLAAASLFASYIPARRAARVDPLVALRYE